MIRTTTILVCIEHYFKITVNVALELVSGNINGDSGLIDSFPAVKKPM